MTRFQITAPEPRFEGRSCDILFVAGVAVVDTDVEAERRALSYFKKAGYVVVEMDADGNLLDDDGNVIEAETEVVDPSVVDEDENENPQVTGGEQVFETGGTPPPVVPEPALPPLPSPNANKPEWIAAAELRGWTYEEADALTKPALQEELLAGRGPATTTEQSTEEPA